MSDELQEVQGTQSEEQQQGEADSATDEIAETPSSEAEAAVQSEDEQSEESGHGEDSADEESEEPSEEL